MFTDPYPTPLGIRLSEVTGRRAVQILTEESGAARTVILQRGQAARAVSIHRIDRNFTTDYIDRGLLERATPTAFGQAFGRSLGAREGK